MVVRLVQNYRSTGRIVRAALSVIAKSRERVPKELWTANDEGLAIDVRGVVDERDEAGQVVTLVKANEREGWARREMAILYRTHAQSRVLEEALRGARIPYKIVGGMRFYERAEVKDLLAYLRLAANPKSDVDVLRVINTPKRGIGNTTVERLTAVATAEGTSVLEALRGVLDGTYEMEANAGARRQLAAFLAIVDQLASEARSTILPSTIAEHAIERSGYRQLLEEEGTVEAQTRLQNLGELVGSLVQYEQAFAAEQPTVWLDGEEPPGPRVPTIAGFLEQAALVAAGDEKGTLGSDDVLTLMTVHAAKGLEFRGVIITGLEEDLFPFRGGDSRTLFQEGGDEVWDADDDMDEERRLAYVAITRARETLTMFHAAQRMVFGQTRPGRPSRFLADLPEADVRRHGITRPDFFQRRGWGSAPPSSSQSSPSSRGRFQHPQSRSSAPPPVARAPGERFVEMDEDVGGDSLRGRIVKHKTFGRGRIVEVIEDGMDPKVVVDFGEHGHKTVIQRFLERG
jgi:DNA helicase-2/ATP-dependent DNA helicase PcrA